jgi:predicted nuclease of predicted toxin-antitoxin system
LQQEFADFGHEATHVQTLGLAAASDRTVIDAASSRGWILVTADSDFGDRREYPPARYPGIVLLELPRDATGSMIRLLVADFLRTVQVQAIAGKLVIVAPGQIRVRP